MRFLPKLFTLLLAAAILSPAHAGLTIRGTRVVFDEARGEANVRVQYTKGSVPILMQAWLDDGNPDLQPGEHDLPFVISPAVARMDPGDVQLLRILRTRDGLPQDRETLLYLNVLEIPPSAADAMDAGQNYMQLSMQARLKFFYRPKGLSLPVTQAVERVRFALDNDADEPGRLMLRIHNPTPYHIVMSALALHAQGDDDAALASFDLTASFAPTVEPFAEVRVPLAADARARQEILRAGDKLVAHYTVINDQGGHNPKQQALEHAP